MTYHIRQLYLTPFDPGNPGTQDDLPPTLYLSLALSRNGVAVDPPEKLVSNAVLRVGGRDFRLSDGRLARTTNRTISWETPGYSWSVGAAVHLSLTVADEEKRVRELRRGASRSGVCGEDTTNSLQNDQEGDTPGLWHCHGDVYHYHADWHKAHNPHIATEDLTPTPDPNPPSDYSAPATAPAGAYTQQQQGAPAINTEDFGNWHTHSDGRFHRHAGGH